MIRVAHILPAGSWTQVAADHITLDQDGRHRRRIAMTSDHGTPFLLDQAEAVQLRHGDGLELEDGRVVRVLAAPEALLEVRAASSGHLLQLAWHLGNRHLATEIDGGRLLIRYDHVIAAMLEQLGATVTRISAPFDPEGGAYGGAHQPHDHGPVRDHHGHSHDHAHHDAEHDHGHVHPHGHPHRHDHAMAEGRGLLQLLTWMSPAFPVGSFGYSHGLEQAIREGLVTDADSLADWITDLVMRGGGWSDAVLLNEAHRATMAGDAPRLVEAAELARALAPSVERAREALHQGRAFTSALEIGWALHIPLPAYTPYCVAVGAAAASQGARAEDALIAFLHGFAANLVGVALRAASLGQTVGVRVIARLEPVITAAARRASLSDLDDLGSATMVSDIMSMRHETLEGRLFIS